ncbi:MAG TPA: CHRD domain-containing protein [Flavobacteriaceae bacterium]|nr:CHRD domain-containing protein [Flavobacteriaceae bacterium]
MKKLMMAAVVATGIFATSCSDDDVNDPINPIGDSQEYVLQTVSSSNISGTVTFMRNDDNSTTVEIDLEGTADGQIYPAHIHYNSVLETGDVAFTLNPVDGETGESTTTFSALTDGTAISYTDLLNFDGYVDVHLSETEMSTIVARADIGGNELTGESKTYNLHEVDVAGITGTATFEQRKNGAVLASLSIEPSVGAQMHPAHIHMNTAAETGDIVFTFNPLDGTTGMSMTNMTEWDDGTALSFQELMEFDGYINVHESADNLGTLLAQSDIGQNELTGESITYDLDAIANTDYSGQATFEERVNGETLISVNLDGAMSGETYPVHIHEGTAAAGTGAISIQLNELNGDTGMSVTNVSELDNGGSISYEGLLDYDGYLDVHLNDIDVLAGDIGSNLLP